MKNKARSIFILYFTKINQFCPGTLWPPTFPSTPASVPPPGAPTAPAAAHTGAARAHAPAGSPSKHRGRGWCPFANAPLPRIQAGNCPKMPPGGPAVSARGTSLGQSHSEYIHAVRRAVCLSVCPSPDGKASPTRLLLGRSVLEARGADVGLVEGVRGVKHLWGRRRGRRQDGAERFVGAQHRGEVLHLLRQLPDLPAQGRVLPLQVFALLGRQKQGGFLSCRCEWGGPGVQCGTWLLCVGSVGAAPHQDTPQHHKQQPSLTHLLAAGWERAEEVAVLELGSRPRTSQPSSFQNDKFPANSAPSGGWANPPPPAGRVRARCWRPRRAPRPRLTRSDWGVRPPRLSRSLSRTRTPSSASRAAWPGGGRAE